MHILQIITDTDRRGAQVFALDLGAALAERGHCVETVALIGGTMTRPLGVDRLGSSARSVRTILSLRRKMAGVDVTIAHGSSTLLACGLAGIGRRRPFVYRQISDSHFWASTRLRRLRVSAYLRMPKRVVALSSSAALTLQTYLRVPSDRISIVANAVPRRDFMPATTQQRAEARERLRISPGSTVVLSISALVPEKGVDDAIAAVARLADTTLVIAGDGPDRHRLQELATQSGASVRFVGAVESRRDVYAAADVVVLPSRGGDSMPASLIEAGMCGIPVVATPIGSIPEIVRDGQTGYIVPCGDVEALCGRIQQLRDPILHLSLGRAAESHCVSAFAIDVVADAWAAVLGAVGGSA